LDDAAEAWRECGVCAIGWVRYGNLRKVKQEEMPSEVQQFLKIKKGDLILAYAAGNRIALVGEVEDGKYMHTEKNVIGLDEDDGGFGYPNQYRVRWYDKPHDFSRKDLPSFLTAQLGKRGRTVVPLNLYKRSFDEAKRIILTSAASESLSYDINEDTVKAGIRKYLGHHLDSLENGLKVMKAERSTGKTDRPDFVAKDKKGETVIIECKGNAYAGDCDQLERYGRNLRKQNPRLMLVAFRIDDGCLDEAKKNSRIELYQCDLEFQRIS
jgi:hypothetical protein